MKALAAVLLACALLAAAQAPPSRVASAHAGIWQILAYTPGAPSFRGAAAIAADARDNIYVADAEHGQIQKLSSSGARLAIFGSFGWRPGYFRNPTGVALDSRGNLYVTDSWNNRVQKLSPSGRPLVVYRGDGHRWCGDFGLGRSVTVDAQGYVYVDVLNGCTVKTRTSAIEKLSPQGNMVAAWPVPPCLSLVQCWRNNVDIVPDKRGADLATDRHGNVYLSYFPSGDDCNGDHPLGYVYKLSRAGRILDRWSFARAQCDSSGHGLAVDAGGSVHVADNQSALITTLSPSGTVVGQWKPPPFSAGPALDAQRNLYFISDFQRVTKLSSAGGLVAAWGAWGAEPGRYQYPSAVAVDRNGHAYVADTWNGRIQKLRLNPGQDTLVPLQQWHAPAQPGVRYLPTAVVIDKQGNVVVGDEGAHEVQTFSPAGKLLHVVRMPGHGSGFTGYIGGQGAMGLAADAEGNLVVTDPTSGHVEKLAPGGELLATYGAWATARTSTPAGVALDRANNIYIADRTQSRVVKLSPSGRRLAVWGGARPGQFNHPEGIALDGLGDIYVADTGNSRIQELSPAGAMLGVWGGMGAAPGQFMYPIGISVDAQGAVYVADTFNDRVQRLALLR